ncbi:transposase [Gluconobacter thailandicus]|nr:transposase [Gluconobacter thailandicus]
MFKIRVIQTLNTLSDERTEYLISDYLSFMRFLSPGGSNRVPRAETIWLLRERLTQTGAIERLFDPFRLFSLWINWRKPISCSVEIRQSLVEIRTIFPNPECRENHPNENLLF